MGLEQLSSIGLVISMDGDKDDFIERNEVIQAFGFEDNLVFNVGEELKLSGKLHLLIIS